MESLAGHKFPTAYPSRRAWLHVTVRDGTKRVLFESGRITASGLIEGNANDTDPARHEPHYREITQPAQVQIYEAIMEDEAGAVTTGLLQAVRYVKDNRLVPRGFDKRTAAPDVAVVGRATADESFTAGGDRTRYVIDLGRNASPYEIEVALRFQPIGFRWAENLARYDAAETGRFVRYNRSMAASSSHVLVRSAIVVPGDATSAPVSPER